MSLDEGLSDYLGRIYEAVHNPEQWHAVVDELRQRTRSRIALLAFADLEQQALSRHDLHGPQTSAVERGVVEYAEVARDDPALAFAVGNPGAGMCDTRLLMADDDFRKLPFIRWQQARFGTEHWRVVYSQPSRSQSFALSLHPEKGADLVPERLHRLFYDHFARALRLAARPVDLDGTSEAVFLIDEHARILARSARADELLRADDGLRARGQVLEAALLPASGNVAAMAARLLASEPLRPMRAALRIPRLTGRTDWLMVLDVIPRAVRHLPISMPRITIRVIEPDRSARLGLEVARLFAFSDREEAVAAALLAGHSIESLSETLGISRNTARVHLRSLFRKTRTSRQSELIMLLLRLSLH